MPAEAASIRVTVAFALPQRQWLIELQLPAGATVAEAIDASAIEVQLVDQPIDRQRVGIFGKPCSLQTTLRDGDRVELYRPLACDPKSVRRQRAEVERAPGKRGR